LEPIEEIELRFELKKEKNFSNFTSITNALGGEVNLSTFLPTVKPKFRSPKQ